MAWKDRVKNAGSKVSGGFSKVFRRQAAGPSATNLEQTEGEKLMALRLKRAEAEARAPYQLFDRAAFVRGTKKYSAIIIILILIALPVIIFVYLSTSSHTGFFSYQEQSYYGPIFSGVWSYISPIWGLISGELACVANPVSCVGVQNTNVTQNVYPTFTSFLSANPSQGTQTTFITSSYPGTPADLFYTVQNTANVPLGYDTSNNVLLNTSCGSTDDPAATFNCQYSTNITSPKPYDARLSPVLEAGQTITNQTAVNVFCPTNLQVQLDSIASIQLNFTITNYSAASIVPIEFVTNAYATELSIAGQELVPNAPTVSFVSPGPISIILSTSDPQPIETQSGNMPISVQVSNANPGNSYSLNALSVFIPMSLWSVNVSSEISQLNPIWSCSQANGGRTMGFVLPSSGYWNCTAKNPNDIVQLVLPQVLSLPGAEHFDTVPLLAHVNYNYIQKMNMPYVIRGSSAVSCSS